MYLNDHARHYFYEALGLNTTQFNRHVILETNNATARIFPEVRRAAPCPPLSLCPCPCLPVGVERSHGERYGGRLSEAQHSRRLRRRTATVS